MDQLLHLKRQLVPWPVSGPYAVNLSLCLVEYFVASAALCAWSGRWPPRRLFVRQATSSVAAAPWYALLPTVVERSSLLHFGRPSLREALAFCAAVEVLVYVVHRLLHEVPWLYRHVHRRHHAYKTACDMSPFASMSFMPLDGLAQASPYVLVLLVLPCHALVWELLLFATGAWSAYIHCASEAPCRFALGASHHTKHHTLFKANYGHYTQAMDALCGTLR